MGAADMPSAEIDINGTLVRDLLVDQHPDLADLALLPLAFGWDNVIFRLGDQLTVRLPRRQAAGELIDHELRWLPLLAPHLPLSVPVPVRWGRPGPRFPWSWSISPWLPGTTAATTRVSDPHQAAVTLGRFLTALHIAAPPTAPVNPHRGIPLGERDARVRDAVKALGETIPGDAVLVRWDKLVGSPVWDGPTVWLHGDLHPANLLVHDDQLSAVIDFGDLTSGDPATDLAVAWMLFGPRLRAVFREAAGGPDHDTWSRAQGWALALALAYLAHAADDPAMTRIGRRTLDAVLADRA